MNTEASDTDMQLVRRKKRRYRPLRPKPPVVFHSKPPVTSRGPPGPQSGGDLTRRLSASPQDHRRDSLQVADVGAEDFASDQELYAEKTRKQREFQTSSAGQHAPPLSPSPSPLVCTATKAAGYKKDRADEISNEKKSDAAPEHKADREFKAHFPTRWYSPLVLSV